MNVIEKIKELLSNSSLMDEFNGGTHLDYTEDVNGTFGLYSNGSVKISEDILGNVTYQHSFVAYANMQAFEDYNRLSNSEWLLNLTYLLDTLSGDEVTARVGNVEHIGYIQAISAANAMLFSVPTGDINDGVNYQIQINVTYKIMEDE